MFWLSYHGCIEETLCFFTFPFFKCMKNMVKAVIKDIVKYRNIVETWHWDLCWNIKVLPTNHNVTESEWAIRWAQGEISCPRANDLLECKLIGPANSLELSLLCQSRVLFRLPSSGTLLTAQYFDNQSVCKD